jgi:hypothetical protein
MHKRGTDLTLVIEVTQGLVPIKHAVTVTHPKMVWRVIFMYNT